MNVMPKHPAPRAALLPERRVEARGAEVHTTPPPR